MLGHAQPIEVAGPRLYHLPSRLEVFCLVVDATNAVLVGTVEFLFKRVFLLLVVQLPLDLAFIPAQFVERGAGHVAQVVMHDLSLESHARKGGVDRAVGHASCDGALAGKHILSDSGL
jgi:hypothetical protein